MDLHAPDGPVRSLRDFLAHLGIVTLGILIALGLDQLVEAHRAKRLAAEAVAGFHHEISDNEASIKDVLHSMPELRSKIDQAITQLSAPPTDGATQLIHYPGISLDVLSTASWDTAIATHALNELPYSIVKRYADAYGVLRLFADQEQAGLTAWEGLRRFGNDARAMTPAQRITMIEELRRYESVLVAIEFAGNSGLKSCDAALN